MAALRRHSPKKQQNIQLAPIRRATRAQGELWAKSNKLIAERQALNTREGLIKAGLVRPMIDETK